MSDPRLGPDELELKKRARRRLVGAVAFASFAAVVLPMVMDDAPPPAGHDIELRIPGQEQLSSSPMTAGKPAPGANRPVPPADSGKTDAPVKAPVESLVHPKPATTAEAAPSKPDVVVKPAGEAPRPAAAKPAVAPSDTAAKPAPAGEGQRAQAILEGKPASVAPLAAASEGPHVVLIGAFADAANVKTLQGKLGELGIKTYTEALESPQGRKTRVRAGPFANRAAAEKAAERMKRIGVNGVVAPKP